MLARHRTVHDRAKACKMADWEKLAGEKGEAVPSGRFGRMLKLGALSARVTANSLVGKATGLFAADEEAHRQQLMEKNARQIVDVLGQLKGASMKVGQLLSADPELTPPGFADMLSGLQRSAPPMTFNTVRAQIEGALDRPLDAVFSYLDPEPLGSASIGQVHKARLRSGEEVAVKVQYPGVAAALESDLRSLSSVMGYGRAVVERERLDEYMSEIRLILEQEADYELEARTLARWSTLLQQRPGLRCPRPFPEWTRKNVLTMELVRGEKLDDALNRLPEGPDRQRLLESWVHTFSWMFHEVHELHADPHPGNFLLDEGGLVLLDFGCTKQFEPAFTDGMLDVLIGCWLDEPERAPQRYRELGFGAENMNVDEIDPLMLEAYHRIILAPFLTDTAFDFSTWRPAQEVKQFMRDNPKFMKLIPPRHALPYFRVLSGIKGLLAKVGGRVNVCRPSIEIARRRGRLHGEPMV
jgi:predicted unusual protein kinase regulating ubiquinone biosynthesis (AarF/ABC1/UbiB family)